MAVNMLRFAANELRQAAGFMRSRACGFIFAFFVCGALITPQMAAAQTTSSAAAKILNIDPQRSVVHFDIGVLLVLRRSGTFSSLEGTIEVDSQAQSASIRVRIPAATAHMKDPDQTRLLLSDDFFDAAQHPWIEFSSEAFSLKPSSSARQVRGRLLIRGVERSVVFSVTAGACLDAPGTAPCNVRVDGQVKRSNFGMVSHRRTLGDQVRLRIEVALDPIGANATDTKPKTKRARVKSTQPPDHR